jgi:hypothetical protein
MARTRKNTQDPASVTVDWNAFEASVDADGKARLAAFAEKYGVWPVDARKMIADKYGDRVDFRKGRYGGVFLKSAPASAGAEIVEN